MAVVIGSASIKITALAEDLKRDIGKELNDALGDIKVNANPLKGLNSELGRTVDSSGRARDSLGRFVAGEGAADRETSKLHKTMAGLRGITRGLGAAFSYLLPSMAQARIGSQILGTTLNALAKVTALALAGQAAFAGAGGLLAVAGALSQAAGAALLIPAALGAGVIAIGALTVGFQGMGEAFKSVGDPAKFGEAIKNLAPSARDFAVAVRDAVPAFKELRLQVQDRLFTGLAKDFSDLAGIHIPIVQRGLTAMAASLNEAAKGFAAFARDKQTISDLGTLFANSSLGAHFLAQAVQPVLSALRDIGTVGSEFLPGLADGFAGAATRFGEFIAHARESGRLREILSGGLSALGDIFSILGNIGSILGSVLQAGQAAGAGFLSTARGITGELAQWARSLQGQAALGDFFAAARTAGLAILPILGSVVQLVTTQLVPILANLATTVGPSVRVAIDAISSALGIARPGIDALAAGFADFITALAPALPAVGNLARVLGESLGTVLTAIGPVIAKVASVFADQLAETLPRLVPAIVSITSALGDLLVALAPLIPSLVALLGPFVEAGGIIDALVPIVEILVGGIGELVEILGPLISIIADSLIVVLNGVRDVLPDLVGAFLDLVRAIAPVVAELLPPLVDLFAALLPILGPVAQTIALIVRILAPLLELLGPVIEALSVVVGLAANFVTDVLNLGAQVMTVLGVTEAATTSFTESAFKFEEAVAGAFGRVGVVLEDGEAAMGAWATRVRDEAAAAVGSVLGFATGAATAMGQAGSFISTGMERIKNILRGLTEPAGQAGSAAGLSFTAGVSSALSGAVAAAANAAGLIGATLARDYSAAGAGIINSLASGIRGAIPNAVAAARAATGAIAAWLPRSPALVGPFSGQGWTLFRGMALIQGLAEGIARSLPLLRRYGLAAAAAVSESISPRGGIPPGGLPRVGPAPPRAPAGEKPMPSASLHDEIIAAIRGWQVIISAREAANSVNRVNKDNVGR